MHDQILYAKLVLHSAVRSRELKLLNDEVHLSAEAGTISAVSHAVKHQQGVTSHSLRFIALFARTAFYGLPSQQSGGFVGVF